MYPIKRELIMNTIDLISICEGTCMTLIVPIVITAMPG